MNAESNPRIYNYSVIPNEDLDEWIKMFAEAGSYLPRKYNKEYRLTERVRFSQFIDELDPLRVQTGLRTVNYATTPLSFRKDTEEVFVKDNIPVLRRLASTKEFDELSEWFTSCYRENVDGTKQMLQNLYNSYLAASDFDIAAIVNLMKLLAEFDYDEMEPIGLMMVSSAVALDNDRVRSEAVKVLSHWGNMEAYNLFQKLMPPTGFLYSIQYKAVKKSFEQKYGLHTQDR